MGGYNKQILKDHIRVIHSVLNFQLKRFNFLQTFSAKTTKEEKNNHTYRSS